MGAKFESDLSPQGEEIAHAKGVQLKDSGFYPERVYTSQLRRTKQTADIILKVLGIEVEPINLTDLNERDFGDHDGKPYSSVIEAFNMYGENPPSIENVSTFVQRVTTAWDQILAESPGVDTLVITHSNPEMVLECLATKKEQLERFWELGDPAYCEGFEYQSKQG